MNWALRLLIITFFCTPTYSMDLNQIYVREKNANVTSLAGRKLIWTYDTYLNENLMISLGRLNKMVLNWVQEWFQTISIIENWQGNNQELELIVSKFVQKSGTDLANINELTYKLAKDADQVDKALSEWFVSGLDDLRDEKQKMTRKKQDILALARSIAEETKKISDRLEKVQNMYSANFLLKAMRLKLVQLGISEIDISISRINQMVHEEIFVEPILSKLESLSMKIHRSLLYLQQFELRKLIEQLRNQCLSSRTKLDANIKSAPYFSSASERLERLCSEPESRFQYLIKNYSPQKIAQDMHENNKKRFLAQCIKNSIHLGKRCDLKNILVNITSDQIQNYDEQKIERLESLWSIFENSIQIEKERNLR